MGDLTNTNFFGYVVILDIKQHCGSMFGQNGINIIM